MFVKRYLVNNMQEAMAKIRKELGNDAVILNSRFVRQKGLSNMFKKKKLEVVAAYDSKIKKKETSLEANNESVQKIEIAAQDDEKIEQINDKIEELQKIVQTLAEKFDSPEKPEKPRYSREVSRLYKKMIENDVTAPLADEIAKGVEKVISKMDVDPGQVTEQIIIERLGNASPVKIKKYKRNIVLLLGPTGVGKTTTLVKLAGHFVADEGLKVGIINTDTFRVAAKEQLRIYADIMEIPLNTAYTHDELKKALIDQDDRDLIFIDTAGKSCSDAQFKIDIENIVNTCEPDEIYIVLSLPTGYKAFTQIIDNLSFVGDYKVILTKLDEIETWGNILNFADYVKKPLSYLTNGQNIPEDIEQANMPKIASNILK